MLNAVLGGAALYPIRQFSRRTVCQMITSERLTFFGGVPHMFTLLAQTSPRERVDLSSLRIIFSSSAPLAPADNREFHKAYGVFVRQLYGSSETGTISYNDHPSIEDHLDSVGRPLPGVAFSVIADNGEPARRGSEGEIAVLSPFAVSSYAGNPEATARSFRDGVYLTGDLGRVDSENCLTLTGRKSLMINRSGYKVNPREVEEAIREHPKVADVVVLGWPPFQGDQSIRCVLVAKTECSPEEIIRHCRGRIADYKIPTRIEFRDQLPKSSTGKIQRFAL
jgi:long-chain acyl-CoA synthetase